MSSNFFSTFDVFLRPNSSAAEQCNALLHIGRGLATETSPVIINTTLLKLVDIFRNSNNLVRFVICIVIKQCTQQQLLKILNIGEVLRRISSVLQSNDPLARAITLRTLGNIPILLTNKLYIHHGIHAGLQSRHPLEIDAAIFAIDNLCSISPIFAQGIIEKIAVMIEGIETSLSTKLKLIRVFRHMYHSPDIAMQSRRICTNLIQIYPGKIFFLTILDTLTALSEKSLLDIPDQIQLLFTTLHNDPRRSVKLLALKNINRLATIAPQYNYQLESLLLLVVDSPYNKIKLHALWIIQTLSSSMYTQLCTQDSLQICQEYLYHEDVSIVSACATILARVAICGKLDTTIAHHAQNLAQRLSTSFCIILSSRLLSKEHMDFLPPGKSLVPLLSTLTDLIMHYPTLADKVVQVLVSLLSQTEHPQPMKHSLLICQCLARIVKYNSSSLRPYLRDLCSFIQQAQTVQYPSVVSCICISLFDVQHEDVVTTLLPVVQSLLDSRYYWPSFIVGREAFLRGVHSIAKPVFSSLSQQVESECFYMWLQGLSVLSAAEMDITVSKVPRTITLLHSGLASLSASTTSSSGITFQRRFVELRISFLKSLLHLYSALIDWSSSLGGDAPQSPYWKTPFNGESVTRHSKQFRELADNYTVLHRGRNVDVDSATVLKDYQCCCSFVAILVESMLSYSGGVMSNSLPVNELDAILGVDSSPIEGSSIIPVDSSRNRSHVYSLCLQLAERVKPMYKMLTEASVAQVQEVVRFVVHKLVFPGVYPRAFFVRSFD